MKEMILQFIERARMVFNRGRVQQPENTPEEKAEKANANTRKLQRFLTGRFDFRHNQLTGVTEYRGKRLGYVTEPRLASFIATTNSRQLLSDPTGSRRFFCVEVTRMISEERIEHKQLYAQLKREAQNGERDYLNKVEEKQVQHRNKAYYRQSPLEDVFHAYFRHPEADEEGQWFTATDMFRMMNKHNASALRGISAKQLSFRLTAMGFKPRHTDHGNFYHVVQVE